MAKLKDLVNVNINRDEITIQGAKLPVIFTMQSFPFVEEAYGKSYIEFEKDLNAMLAGKEVRMGQNEIKLMISLIYGMVRSGGTECTPEELQAAIPLSDMPSIFEAVLRVFNGQIFQEEDVKKLHPKTQNNKKKRPQNKKRRPKSPSR